MAERGSGGDVVRDLETYLAALREELGDEVVADPAGTVVFASGSDASAEPDPRSAGPGDGSPSAPVRRPVARDGETVRPPTPPAAVAASWSAPVAPRPGPAAGVAAPRAPVQTSFLPEEPLAVPASPGLRRPGTREPGVVEYRGPSPIVRGPCRPEVRAEKLAELDRQVRACTKCRLHEGRTNTVFGVGHPCARVCFVGEGPGAEEDKRGEPFVGRAGQLLDRIIAAMKLRRSEVYICNTVKCRPPENRTPYPDEIQACEPYLRGQLENVAPQVIVALGRPAANTLLGANLSVGDLRGRFHFHRDIPVRVTYHPAYLLRNPDAKKQTWEDVQHVMRFLAEHPDPMAPSGGERG